MLRNLNWLKEVKRGEAERFGLLASRCMKLTELALELILRSAHDNRYGEAGAEER